jgi:hypothetical protein
VVDDDDDVVEGKLVDTVVSLLLKLNVIGEGSEHDDDMRSLFMAKEKLVPTKSTSSEPTSRRLIPPNSSAPSRSRPTAEVTVASPMSKQTEAARLSNWRPAKVVAQDDVVAKVGDELEEAALLKSNKSRSRSDKAELLLAPLDTSPFLVGVWTE